MPRHYWLFVLLPLLLFSCRKKDNTATQDIIRPVRVVKVEALGSISKQYTGIVEADQFSILAFKVSGTLTELNVKTGQQIKKGNVIARINPYDYRRQFQSSKANYEVAKSIYERTKRLYEANATALQNLEIAEADYIRATSALSISQRTLDYTSLTAPFDGFIEKRFVENYEEVLTGQAIVKLVNPENIKIDFIIPETSIQLLQVPKKIFVEFDTRKDLLFTSEVKEYIYSSNGLGIPVTLNITDEEFAPYRKFVLPGFSCKVIFVIDNMISDSFVIPSGALFEEQGNQYVWTINPKTLTAHRQKVVATKLNDQVLIKEGLSSDNLIVIAGVNSIRDGQKVSISKNE